MTDLKAQRRLAADVLGVGTNRVRFDSDAQSDIAQAITREDIRGLVADGTIEAKDAKKNSRGRAREREQKRSYGHQSGAGNRSGKAGARENRKDAWVSRIRAQRRRLKELRANDTLTSSQYRTLYDKAGGGEFDSVARLEAYAKDRLGVEIEEVA